MNEENIKLKAKVLVLEQRVKALEDEFSFEGTKFLVLTDDLEIQRAVKAFDMASLLWEMSYNTRKSLRWVTDAIEDETEAGLIDRGVTMAFTEFYTLLEEHGIVIDDLM